MSDTTQASDGSKRPPRAPLAPGLHLVATPIGNLGDLSPRALATLRDADLVVCEDTRVTMKLLGLANAGRRLERYDEHHAAQARPRIVERLLAGETVALASDAGTPLVSDPGYKLVRAAIEAGVEVFAVPGPSAALAALAVAGLPTDRFFVQGFLPASGGKRRRALADLARVPGTLVVFEAAHRLATTLEDLLAALGPRPAAVTRELTKRFEEVRRGGLDDLARHHREEGPPRGEIVIVVAPPPEEAVVDEPAVEQRLQAALERLPASAAAAEVAAQTGVPRREVYRRALALKQPRAGGQ